MSETEDSKDIEISTEEQRKFLDAIGAMPENGIALRGDPLIRAEQLQDGLNEPQINYIIFTPPIMRPKTWSKEAQSLYRQLNSAVNMALVYADPWYDTGARTSITDPDFVSYRDYYTNNPNRLPAVTWFTEAEEGQFDQVINSGRTWLDYEIRHHTGDVSSFGQIPAENIQPTIVLDEEDIKQAQENLLISMANNKIAAVNLPKGKLLQRVMSGLSSKKGEQTDTLSLKNKRGEFRDELGKIATVKLCERMTDAFKTN